MNKTNTSTHTDFPIVSILCVTYNHKKFISETLDSFLMQKTKFPFEIIIHDDASGDGTPQIIKRYASQNPQIKPLYETENQYSQGKDEFIDEMYAMAKGKYIALCEGDDFWVDPDKLQRQVDYLEERPDYALCFHPVNVFYDDGSKEPYAYPDSLASKSFSVDTLLERNFIQSNSVMYRRQKPYKTPNNIVPRDWYGHLYHAQFGKIGFINRTMAAYRRHRNGMWWESDKNIDVIWRKHGIGHIRLYLEMLTMFGSRKGATKTVANNIRTVIQGLCDIDRISDEGLVRSAIKQVPAAIELFVDTEYAALQAATETITQQAALLADLRHVTDEKELQLKEREQELNLIKASRIWRIRNRTARILGKK